MAQSSSAPLQALNVRVYPIFTVRWLAVHVLGVPTVFFSWRHNRHAAHPSLIPLPNHGAKPKPEQPAGRTEPHQPLPRSVAGFCDSRAIYQLLLQLRDLKHEYET